MTDRIKLIGIDLDGTFLKDDKTLCDGAADTIRRAAEAGICTVPITGRPFSGIPQCIRDIDEIKYVICSNGSEIIDFKSGKSIYSSTLDNETVNKILAVLNQRGCLYEVFADGYGYIDKAVYGFYKEKYTGTVIGEYIFSQQRCSHRQTRRLTRFLLSATMMRTGAKSKPNLRALTMCSFVCLPTDSLK